MAECARLGRPFLAGKALAVDSALTSLLLAAGDRRATSPPTTHNTMQRPSKLKPNQTAGEKMILEAQVPKAMVAFQSNLRSPLKYKRNGSKRQANALDHPALVPSSPGQSGSDHAEQRESNAQGQQYGVNSRHSPNVPRSARAGDGGEHPAAPDNSD